MLYILTFLPTTTYILNYSPRETTGRFPPLRDLWVTRQQDTVFMHRDICPILMPGQPTLAKSTLLPLRLTQASRANLYP